MLLALVLGVIGLNSTHQLAKHYHTQQLTEQLNESARKANQQLDSELVKFQQIPDLLSNDPRLSDYFNNPNSKIKLNPLLHSWARQSLADTIYVHNLSGEVVASSNYQDHNSFVGENFAYRPYFHQAVQGVDAQYVALGARSNVRGYFLSAPLFNNEEIFGVITVKVSLENIEQLITIENSDILVIDQNQVAFLSSNENWLYQSIQTLPETKQQEIERSRQYGNESISAISFFGKQLPVEQDLLANQLLTRDQFSLYPLPFNKNGYQVIAIKQSGDLTKSIIQADIIFFIIYSLVALIAWSWRQTYKAKAELINVNQYLETTVEKRTQHLQQANQQLQHTVHQYQQSQQRLKQTEEELTQAAKLAVLGELSASINHEINQPLAALRTYSENSLKLLAMDKYAMVEANLKKMIELNSTISEIIARLKVFTRKVTKQEHHQASLHDSIHNATSLLSTQFIHQGITVRLPTVPPDIIVSIHPTELEQVLVNLIHNSIQALSEHDSPQIGIEWQVDNTYCNVTVWDNGQGVEPNKLGQLFDPFYTSKPEGLGLGLSISKRIIEAYNGTLTAQYLPAKGMQFSIKLPQFKPDSLAMRKEAQ
ncbi:ATP-binding protein [Vibrio makurazakiensis]|uniref:ATP-binding protein n=1 Tax=Vibrio makurazakiensis TaxID=2910250 RepID=UPI003D12F30C